MFSFEFSDGSKKKSPRYHLSGGDDHVITIDVALPDQGKLATINIETEKKSKATTYVNCVAKTFNTLLSTVSTFAVICILLILLFGKQGVMALEETNNEVRNNMLFVYKSTHSINPRVQFFAKTVKVYPILLMIQNLSLLSNTHKELCNKDFTPRNTKDTSFTLNDSNNLRILAIAETNLIHFFFGNGT